MVQFGRAKHFSKVTLDDHTKYPIWTSAHDDRHDEEWEKPIISSWEVTQEIVSHPLVVPIITVKVEGSDLVGTAWYLHQERKIFAISMWRDHRWTALGDTEGITAPVVLVSVPKILGEEGVRFLCTNLKAENATKIT